MAIRKIRTDEDPILRKKSREIQIFDEKLKDLVDDMYETMYEAQGVGLAAVQVGLLRRLFVVDDYEGHKDVFINPRIEKNEGCQEGFEGCLSVPEKMGKVERAEKIHVVYQDLQGAEKSIEAEGFFARIIQHENDHLDGILYTDRAKEVFNTEDMEEEEA